jgi:hypothetical protein
MLDNTCLIQVTFLIIDATVDIYVQSVWEETKLLSPAATAHLQTNKYIHGAHQHNLQECSLCFISVISPVLQKKKNLLFGAKVWGREFMKIIGNFLLPLIPLKEVYIL